MIDHNFKKKFGQNFIFDKNLLSAICDDAKISTNDEVLEIGAGAGTLTTQISQNAKKVVSYEIDRDLQEHLLGLNLSNVKFVFGDIMDYETKKIEEDFAGEYKMIANLPYYITTPIIFKFLNESEKIKSLTIMVQKEVAQRMTALHGNKDWGVLSVMINFFGKAVINRIVSRKNFHPQPNVDSAVVTIEIDRNKFPEIDKNKFYKFIQAVFSMRRKTLRNNLSTLISKEELLRFDEKILSMRAEMLSFEQLTQIYLKIIDCF